MIDVFMKNEIEVKISENSIDYTQAVKFMEQRVNNILIGQEKELIWFLYHDNIYTCGTSADKNEILAKSNIPILKTNRGGKTTYHGPGQRIVYFMIDLRKRKRDVRKFINLIEKSTFFLLKELNIESKTFEDRVGIWITKYNGISLKKEKKIGAIGLRIKKWVTYHGLSFNISTDLKYYEIINACGLKNFSSTSLKDLNSKLTFEEFDKVYLKYFLKELKNI